MCAGDTNLLIRISHPEGGTESSQPGICLDRSNRRWLTFVFNLHIFKLCKSKDQKV